MQNLWFLFFQRLGARHLVERIWKHRLQFSFNLTFARSPMISVFLHMKYAKVAGVSVSFLVTVYSFIFFNFFVYDIGLQKGRSLEYMELMSFCLLGGMEIKVPTVLKFWIWLRGSRGPLLLPGRTRCVCWEKPRQRAERGPRRAQDTERHDRSWRSHRRSLSGEWSLCVAPAMINVQSPGRSRNPATWHPEQPSPCTHKAHTPRSCLLPAHFGERRTCNCFRGGHPRTRVHHRQLKFSWSFVLQWEHFPAESGRHTPQK